MVYLLQGKSRVIQLYGHNPNLCEKTNSSERENALLAYGLGILLQIFKALDLGVFVVTWIITYLYVNLRGTQAIRLKNQQTTISWNTKDSLNNTSDQGTSHGTN